MPKVNLVHHSIDQELAQEGKRRIQVPETVTLPNGDPATVYREKIVKVGKEVYKPFIIEKKGKKKMTEAVETVKEVQAPKARKARIGTKLDRVVAFVSASPAKSKAELVQGIVEMLNVTPSNANVYLYKALKK